MGGFPGGYNLPQWNLFGYFGAHQVGHLVWPVLFYLPRQRPLRWLGLLVYALPLALMNLLASTRYPALALLWSTPVLLVVGGWVGKEFSVISRQSSVKEIDVVQESMFFLVN